MRALTFILMLGLFPLSAHADDAAPAEIEYLLKHGGGLGTGANQSGQNCDKHQTQIKSPLTT